MPGRSATDSTTRKDISITISVQTVATGLTIFVALGIIFIGIRACFQPSVAARQFGVPLATPADRDFLAIKASRDIAPGVAVLALLAIGDHRVVAYAMLALTLIPILDGVVVLNHADWIFKPAILIHWGMAAVMLMIVALFRGAMLQAVNWRLQGLARFQTF